MIILLNRMYYYIYDNDTQLTLNQSIHLIVEARNNYFLFFSASNKNDATLPIFYTFQTTIPILCR